MGLNIIFEDEQILVVKKDAGIPVQAGRMRMMDLQGLIKNELYKRNRSGGEPYLGLIHRLDQPVEGVMVFAKTPAVAAELSRQVTDGRMKKHYLALLCGKPSQNSGTLVDYLLKDGRTNTSSVVKKGVKDAKRSELNYKVLKSGETTTLVEVELLTGRHHQIRVQMANAGWPLYGDTKYNPKFQDTTEYVQTALCAYKLSFVHPKSKKVMEFCIKPDNSLLNEEFLP
ncbi:MAG: RNA pseudouridine synthase [Lachnospiraceae bacterium]|nr:RNA pseudouridine synthase [Lachnospiraceae bacterium]